MKQVNRRELIKTTAAGVGVALGAGAAGGNSTVTSSDPVGPAQEVVSTFTATATAANLAIDVDDPTNEDKWTTLDIDAPLVELSGDDTADPPVPDPEMKDDGTLAATSDQVSVPDLIDVVLGLDPQGIIVDILEELDIQEDIIDALDLQEDVVDPLIDFINQLGIDQTQAEAIGQLVAILDEELELLPPELGSIIEIGTFVESLLLNPDDEINGLLNLLGVNDMTDLLNTIISFIDGVEEGDFAGLKQFVIDQVQALDLANLLAPVSLETEVEDIEGLVDPDGGDVDLLMEFPLTTVTITPVLDIVGAPDDLPPVDFDLDIELTTGESGELSGTFTETANNPDIGATATVVDNQFTADITDFDLVGLVESLDLKSLLEFVFNQLNIDLSQYPDFTIDGFIQDAEIVSIVENAELLQLIDDLITDEPGRHVIAADLELTFEDLQAVFEDIDVGPDALPGGDGPPTDPNGNGLYEDVDGDGNFNIFDVQGLFNGLESEEVQNNPEAFNFNDDENPDGVGIFDVQGLFNKLG
jgi:PKD repeat protein